VVNNNLALSYKVLNLVASKTYDMRYRARNLYGWSEYSPVKGLLVAMVPLKPQPPVFVAATDSTITVNLNLNTQNQGADIIAHEVSASTDGVTYTPLTSYDGVSSVFTLDKIIDSLTTGQVYRIRVRAQNIIGFGDYSTDLLAAMSSTPLAPSIPTKNFLLST
jgi:hypothetical protein